MYDTIFHRVFGGEGALDNALFEIAKKHRQFAKIKEMPPKDTVDYIESGRYLVFGRDEKKVNKLSSIFATAVFAPMQIQRQLEVDDVFPQASLIKIDLTFCGMIRLLEKIVENELAIYLFEKYEQPLPWEIEAKDFQMLHRVYRRYLKENTDALNEELKHLVETIASKRPSECNEKENESKESWLEKIFSKKEKKYTPVSANCVPKEHMLDLPYSNRMTYVLHGEKGEIIRKIDQELGMHPYILWSLKETAVLMPDGKGGEQYYHRLVYPTKYEGIVASIINTIQLNLGKDGCNRSKVYIKGAKENIYATAIPRKWYDTFVEEVEEYGVEYYFDANNAYIYQKPDEIGICVEGEVELIRLGLVMRKMLKMLANDSYIDKK